MSKKKKTARRGVRAILCSDLHLWHRAPRARNDEDYARTVLDKLAFIVDTQNSCDADVPILVAGDLFDAPKPPYWFANRVIEILEGCDGEVVLVPGQHDLPNHRLDGIEDTPLPMLPVTLLNKRGVYQVWGFKVHAFPYGTDVESLPERDENSIAVCHSLVWNKRPPFPGAPAGGNAVKVLRKMRNYGLVVCGDNHQPFILEKFGSTLVNCGSLVRKDITQTDHKPAIYLWMEDGSVETVPVPISECVFDEDAIEEEGERKADMSAFVDALQNSSIETSVDFEDNVRALIAEMKINQQTEDLIWELIPSK